MFWYHGRDVLTYRWPQKTLYLISTFGLQNYPFHIEIFAAWRRCQITRQQNVLQLAKRREKQEPRHFKRTLIFVCVAVAVCVFRSFFPENPFLKSVKRHRQHGQQGLHDRLCRRRRLGRRLKGIVTNATLVRLLTFSQFMDGTLSFFLIGILERQD